jgi:hypothetical protein
VIAEREIIGVSGSKAAGLAVAAAAVLSGASSSSSSTT